MIHLLKTFNEKNFDNGKILIYITLVYLIVGIVTDQIIEQKKKAF